MDDFKKPSILKDIGITMSDGSYDSGFKAISDLFDNKIDLDSTIFISGGKRYRAELKTDLQVNWWERIVLKEIKEESNDKKD